MKKQTFLYFLSILILLVAVYLKFVSDAQKLDEVQDQSNVGASWTALSAGSFIFN